MVLWYTNYTVTFNNLGKPASRRAGAVCVRRKRTRTTSNGSLIELFEKWSCNPLYYLHLIGREVLTPSARGGLTVELTLTLLILWDVLPGVFLNYPGELLRASGNFQSLAEVMHTV